MPTLIWCVDFEIPDRIKDGYGINESIIEQAHADGVEVILTCDNGISAFHQVELAKKYGMTVVITDHHEVPLDGEKEKIPPADAVIDPKQADCPYPFPEICGAVVAYKLVQVLYARRGVPQIEVTFDIDANGILNVSAKDKGTGKEQKIRIEASSGLTEQEIQKMRDEAKANEEKDKAERERVDKVNAADSMIFSTEKQLKEYGDKIPADKKGAIEAALGKLKDAHKSQDIAAIDSATTELNNAWQAASQDIYNAQQAAGASQANPGADAGADAGAGSASGSAGAGAGQTSNDNVTDVDFEEVK